jgi:uncharacterized RDD family membrane protein YckC
MSENNAEEKEILEQQVLNEEVSEETGEEAVEESVNEELETEELQEHAGENKGSFIKSLSAVIIDEAIIGIISVALLYIADALLKYAGYAITQRVSMLFIIFVVVSVIYTSISESTKSGKTIGKKFLND